MTSGSLSNLNRHPYGGTASSLLDLGKCHPYEKNLYPELVRTRDLMSAQLGFLCEVNSAMGTPRELHVTPIAGKSCKQLNLQGWKIQFRDQNRRNSEHSGSARPRRGRNFARKLTIRTRETSSSTAGWKHWVQHGTSDRSSLWVTSLTEFGSVFP